MIEPALLDPSAPGRWAPPAGAPAADPLDDEGSPHRPAGRRRSVLGWGLGVGVATAATPWVFWWLPATTVHAVAIVLIAAVYLGFAVADGRKRVIAVEAAVVSAFVLLAAVAVTGSPWWVVTGLFAHGLKDLWQHRTGFVAGTRWWPPFCVVVDWVAALLLAAALVGGASFH